MRLDENQTGALDFGDEHYYGISLKKGTYKTILDFTNKPRQVGIARGSLSLLDVMGSESREVLSFNEEGVTIRKIGTFTVDSDGPAIILVSTGWGSVTYNLRIVPADNGS
jgi:hypothetical protein